MARWKKASNDSFEKELLFWHTRIDRRMLLKDIHRCALMDVSKQWAYLNRENPREICIKVHDRINQKIQGVPAKSIRESWQLKKNQLIRDFLDTQYLEWYSDISKFAANLIMKGENPFEAVDQACRGALPHDHVPSLAVKQENVYEEGRKLISKRKKRLLDSGGIQLSFLDLDLFPKAS